MAEWVSGAFGGVVRWPEERYVKLYTRKTVTWHSWPWESKALFPLLMTVCDGAGLVECGRVGEVAGVSMLTGLPHDVVKAGIEGLVATETVLRVSEGLLLPNFLPAQEARASDAQRKRDERERAAAHAKLGLISSKPTESGQAMSHGVTRSHTESQPVTPSPAQPSPAQKETTVEEVFDHWRTKVSPKAKLDSKRERLIASRLKEGFTPEDLKRCVDGYLKSPHHMGQNDRHTKYLGADLMFRDAAHVEQGLGFLGETKAVRLVKAGELYRDA